MYRFLRRYYLAITIFALVIVWAGYNQYQIISIKASINEINDQISVPNQIKLKYSQQMGLAKYTIGEEIARIRDILSQ